MKIKIALAALTFGLASTAANAQYGWYGAAPDDFASVPRYHVGAVVRSAGLRPVSRPARMGRYYIVHAVDNYGSVKQVTIDAAYGDIVRISSTARPTYEPSPFSRPWRRWQDDDIVMTPPAPIRRWREREVERYDEAPQARLAPQRPERSRPPAARPNSEGSRTAAVDPSPNVPLPRSRPQGAETGPAPADIMRAAPAAAPARRETPAARPQTERPPRTAASPRVILPGGPAARGDATGSTAPSDRGVTTPAEPDKQPAREPAKIPPVQGF